MKGSAVAIFFLAALLAVAEGEAATPCPTMTTPHYDYGLDCWAISVEHDATYCIDGPICSGSGTTPAGTLCPVKGDVAIADCHSYLESYTGGQHCVLPVDATCQVIKTGAWGCVLSGSSTPAPTKTCDGECNETSLPNTSTTANPNTPNPTTSVKPCPTCTTKAPAPAGTLPPHHTPTPTPTECTGNWTHSGSGSGSEYVGNVTMKTETTTESSSSNGVSAGIIGAIAAAAAVVAIIAAAAIYKQYIKKVNEEEARENFRVDVVTP